MEGVDLSLFEFDYDCTWMAFFLNADKTIYGRYGTRASSSADLGIDVSIEGFKKALQGALEIHAGFPANKASLLAKRGPPPEANEIREFPLFKGRFAADPPRGCAHCHHVWEALRGVPRRERKPLPDELFYVYPKPDRIGLTLALDERAAVKSVAPDSVAAKAGFAPGDKITTLNGQPILSIADVQWVLQNAKAPCDLLAEVDRGGKRTDLMIRLPENWRKGEDITWRTSTWPMRPFAWQDAAPDQRQALGVADGKLCARVKNVPKNSAGERAGILVGDFIVAVDGKDKPLDENEWLSYVQQDKVRGETITLTIVRNGKKTRVDMKAP